MNKEYKGRELQSLRRELAMHIACALSSRCTIGGLPGHQRTITRLKDRIDKLEAPKEGHDGRRTRQAR